MKKFYILTAFIVLMTGSVISAMEEVSPIKKIQTRGSPRVLGAYSQGISVDLQNVQKLIFVSGQVPLDPQTGRMVDHSIRAATKQTLDNIEAILKASETDWKHVVRTDIFLQNFERDWNGMNEAYAERFPDMVFPVRQTVQVEMSPDTLIEISCIAIVPKRHGIQLPITDLYEKVSGCENVVEKCFEDVTHR